MSVQTKPFDKPTHLAQMEEPWRRLHYAATLSSSRRSATPDEQQVSRKSSLESDSKHRQASIQPQVPGDSLDFQLRSVYDHHRHFFCGKSQMLYQRDTVSEEDG